jgi:hypothetical protein
MFVWFKKGAPLFSEMMKINSHGVIHRNIDACVV